MHRISTSSVQTAEGLLVQFLGTVPTGWATYTFVASYILMSDIHQPPSRANNLVPQTVEWERTKRFKTATNRLIDQLTLQSVQDVQDTEDQCLVGCYTVSKCLHVQGQVVQTEAASEDITFLHITLKYR